MRIQMSQAEFVPFSTFIDTTFWAELNRRKLHEWRLDETPKEIFGSFSLFESVGESCWLSLGHESFLQGQTTGYHGRLLLFNTMESFKGLDRKELLRSEAQKIWDIIESGEWLDYPDRLTSFIFTAYADLKKYQYYYWNCFPTLCYPFDMTQKVVPVAVDERLMQYFDGTKAPVFMWKPNGDCLPISKLSEIIGSEEVKVVFADPSPVRGRAGWPLRNLIAAIARCKPSWKRCSFISLRSGNQLEEFDISWTAGEATTLPPTVGWERTHDGKMTPQFADMKKQFDPKKLMDQAVGLNLSLIKWRLVPEMRLERYSSLRVLIFGAGTLGCNIARCLMGWGVKKITFVDNSSVSYSNPVRQSLSDFDDARESRGKAETAAAALQRIYPSMDSQAVRFTVPMPGHTVSSSEEASLERDVALVDDLVANHDVVFLALDSREARWLPTVLATIHGKMAFSVALGFDNYVVIRHGVRNAAMDQPSTSAAVSVKEGTVIPYSDLACYFCSDVTAPGNSTADRTLDQQCTVSRPGLSMIASGTAVELLSSVLQHPDPLTAPANIGELDDSSSLLGATPHQIRGFLSRFSQMTPCVRRFEKCVACGDIVTGEYLARKAEFVKEVMNSPSYLEKLTGLDQLQASINDVHIEFSDDSDSVMSL
ncbi:unnamed protein product [Cylicocyclus nassatus]|uniref:Ubiquitin-like modifier-activating enzyme ATG7 n=1 Tax=Cylicocyclus nassatus TaxID=53992 RepID=A0AA36H179_CYLNA|nr:unnamed protein product [Cylicocyclus nassatus]